MLNNQQEDFTKIVELAYDYLEKNYAEKKHHTATVLQCGGTYYYAMHLDTRGFDVCAEPIAISNALANRETNFTTIVAVTKNHEGVSSVISPCGNCRQILIEYCPEVQVVVDTPEGIGALKASSLLPLPY